MARDGEAGGGSLPLDMQTEWDLMRQLIPRPAPYGSVQCEGCSARRPLLHWDEDVFYENATIDTQSRKHAYGA